MRAKHTRHVSIVQYEGFHMLYTSPSRSRRIFALRNCSWPRLIFQLRVGHAPLNGYLYRFHKVDSARCPACGEVSETTEHFILRCPKYAHERWALQQHFRDNAPKLEDVLSNTKAAIPLINYVETTGRFAESQPEDRHSRTRAR
jgi:predicted amino acid racemase